MQISENLKKLPNRITMFRIIITFAFIPAILAERLMWNYAALGIFLGRLQASFVALLLLFTNLC